MVSPKMFWELWIGAEPKGPEFRLVLGGFSPSADEDPKEGTINGN